MNFKTTEGIGFRIPQTSGIPQCFEIHIVRKIVAASNIRSDCKKLQNAKMILRHAR